MHCVLVFSSFAAPSERAENAGLDLRTVEEQLRARSHTVQLADAAWMDRAELFELYLKAMATPRGRYRAARVFGSAMKPGADFGVRVPALIVTGQLGDPPVDVYPHEERDGRIVTIADFLNS